LQEGQPKAEENLYETSLNQIKLNPSQKFITFEIRECDEDNFEESVDDPLGQKRPYRGEGLLPREGQTISCQNLEGDSRSTKKPKKTERSRELNMKRQSNSPYLIKNKAAVRFSVNKILSQTHFQGKEWKAQK
jgi:hypothetical protein